MTETSYINLVRLIIINEIHLLHDERGPILDSIVACMIHLEQTAEYVRSLSYVTKLWRCRNLIYFDASYRPCGLQQQFIGITEKKVIKQYQVMNEVCYKKVLDQAGKNQTLIFIHSRKETTKTASEKFLSDMAIEKETITQFIKPDTAMRSCKKFLRWK